jgi:hypothetical protein
LWGVTAHYRNDALLLGRIKLVTEDLVINTLPAMRKPCSLACAFLGVFLVVGSVGPLVAADQASGSLPSPVFQPDGAPVTGQWAGYRKESLVPLDEHLAVWMNYDERYRAIGLSLEPGHLSGLDGLEKYPAWKLTVDYAAAVVKGLENYGDNMHLLFKAEDSSGLSLFVLRNGLLRKVADLPATLRKKGSYVSLHPFLNLMADSAPRAKVDKGVFLVVSQADADVIEGLLLSPHIRTVVSEVGDRPFDTETAEQFAPDSFENVYGSRPEIVPYANPDGTTSVAWAGKKGIHLSEFSVELQLTGDRLLPPEWPLFGGFTRDPSGNYYVLTGRKNRDGDFASNLRLVKYGPDGKKLAACSLPTGTHNGFNVMNPFDAGSSRLVASEDSVYIHMAKIMHRYVDGLNHQSGILATVRTKSMQVDMAASMTQTTGHSFDQRTILDHGQPIILDLADNYPRGITLGHPPSGSDSRVVFTYKTEMGSKAVNPAGKKLGVGMWSNDNNTYSELGGVQALSPGYVVLAAAESHLDNKLAKAYLNEPRNLFMVLVAPEFWKQPGGSYQGREEVDLVSDKVVVSSGPSTGVSYFYDFGGGRHFQRNCGVVWLTNYENLELANALRPKLAALSDGRLVALWEKWTRRAYQETWYMIFDSGGRILSPAESLGPQRLQRGDDVIVSSDRVVWFTGEANRERLVAHILQP